MSAMVIGLIVIGIVVVLAFAMIANSVHLEDVDPWIASELEAMDAVDRLLEASEQAREEMRRVSA